VSVKTREELHNCLSVEQIIWNIKNTQISSQLNDIVDEVQELFGGASDIDSKITEAVKTSAKERLRVLKIHYGIMREACHEIRCEKCVKETAVTLAEAGGDVKFRRSVGGISTPIKELVDIDEASV